VSAQRQYVIAATTPITAVAPTSAAVPSQWNKAAVTAANWSEVASLPGRFALG
jgi:hypothetical protein